jgi:hypothetical protein
MTSIETVFWRLCRSGATRGRHAPPEWVHSPQPAPGRLLAIIFHGSLPKGGRQAPQGGFMKLNVWALSVLLLFGSALTVEAQEFPACIGRTSFSSLISGASPGSLATTVNMPCRWSASLRGAVRGAPLGRAAGIVVLQQPRNGIARAEGRSSLVFAPTRGFSGSDSMLVRVRWVSGASALVRFAITVS